MSPLEFPTPAAARPTPVRAAAILALCVLANGAQAQYIDIFQTVTMGSTVNYNSAQTGDALGKFSFAHLTTNGGALVSASANLATGILRATNLGIVVSQPGSTRSSAESNTVVMQDYFQIHGDTNGTATLSYRFDGDIVPGLRPFDMWSGYADLTLRLTHQTGRSFTARQVLADNACERFPGSGCVKGLSLDVVSKLDFPTLAGQWHLFASVTLGSQGGAKVDFGNTVRMYLDLPDNTTMTSRSGVLLTQATPVPEPGTYALMALGLGAVGLLARRRNLPR